MENIIEQSGVMDREPSPDAVSDKEDNTDDPFQDSENNVTDNGVKSFQLGVGEKKLDVIMLFDN